MDSYVYSYGQKHAGERIKGKNQSVLVGFYAFGQKFIKKMKPKRPMVAPSNAEIATLSADYGVHPVDYDVLRDGCRGCQL
jgi:hypothetical protein